MVRTSASATQYLDAVLALVLACEDYNWFSLHCLMCVQIRFAGKDRWGLTNARDELGMCRKGLVSSKRSVVSVLLRPSCFTRQSLEPTSLKLSLGRPGGQQSLR